MSECEGHAIPDCRRKIDSTHHPLVIVLFQPYLSTEDVAMGYKQLHVIDRVNRDLKHTVDVRPYAPSPRRSHKGARRVSGYRILWVLRP